MVLLKLDGSINLTIIRKLTKFEFANRLQIGNGQIGI